MYRDVFFHIGFASSRDGITSYQLARLRSMLQNLMYARLHHGDCVGGDRQAHAVARDLDIAVTTHPANKPRLRAWCMSDEVRDPKPILERNRDIIEESHVLIACPRGWEEDRRSGTWATVHEARNRGLPLIIVWPDGSTTRENGRPN